MIEYVYKEYNDNMMIAFYPRGTREASFLFILNENQKLECIAGTRRNKKINSIFFLKNIKRKGEVTLFEEDYEEIIGLADIIMEETKEKRIDEAGYVMGGGWKLYYTIKTKHMLWI